MPKFMGRVVDWAAQTGPSVLHKTLCDPKLSSVLMVSGLSNTPWCCIRHSEYNFPYAQVTKISNPSYILTVRLGLDDWSDSYLAT